MNFKKTDEMIEKWWSEYLWHCILSEFKSKKKLIKERIKIRHCTYIRYKAHCYGESFIKKFWACFKSRRLILLEKMSFPSCFVIFRNKLRAQDKSYARKAITAYAKIDSRKSIHQSGNFSPRYNTNSSKETM